MANEFTVSEGRYDTEWYVNNLGLFGNRNASASISTLEFGEDFHQVEISLSGSDEGEVIGYAIDQEQALGFIRIYVEAYNEAYKAKIQNKAARAAAIAYGN